LKSGKRSPGINLHFIVLYTSYYAIFRKPFKIKKTWERSKPVVSAAEEHFENFDGRISPDALTAHLPNPSLPRDPVSREFPQGSGYKSPAKSPDTSSVKKETPASRELRGILENVPSLRNSPIPAHRLRTPSSLQEASSSREINPKSKESTKKTDKKIKQSQQKSLSTKSQQQTG